MGKIGRIFFFFTMNWIKRKAGKKNARRENNTAQLDNGGGCKGNYGPKLD